MKIGNNFQVFRKDDQIILTQTITKTMNVKESMQELVKLRSESLQVLKQKEGIQKAIDTKQPQKDLEQAKEQVEILRKLEKDWANIIKEDEEKLYHELRAKVKVSKAEKGWDRIKSDEQKIVLANQILGPITNDLALDMSHPVVMRVKREFDKI